MPRENYKKNEIRDTDENPKNLDEYLTGYTAGYQFSGPHRPLEESEQILKYPSDFDRMLHAWLAEITLGISPASLILAYIDWFLHLLVYPIKQQELLRDANRKIEMFLNYVKYSLLGQKCDPCIVPQKKDSRFENRLWQELPFAFYAQGFLLTEHWWQLATTHIHGVSRHHTEIVNFVTRQWLDMLSPSNFLPTNPEVIKTTLDEQGQNLIKGLDHLIDDLSRFIQNELPRDAEQFKLGTDLATCEGKIIYRNSLFELIQYAPKTQKVYPEPILIIPAWIMKYYILDLSPNNSMVKFLLEKGHTVFMISWKNPDKEDSSHGLSDYLKEGVIKAIEIVSKVVPNQKIHATGYCVGGTILTMAAAYLAKHNKNLLKSLTLFATQIDFADAGELLMFIDESELAYLDDLMWNQGNLKKWQLSGAFNMLRSKDLIWSRWVRDYLKGKEEKMFDLMAWNADATRIPYKLHAEYLRSLYLNNDLIEHRYQFEDTIIDLDEIRIPVFAVATEKDHIAPWKSVFKLHALLATELTFILTNGGHNAGIISEPGHKDRKFEIRVSNSRDHYISPEKWREKAEKKSGSWWLTWQNWLKNDSQAKTTPPEMGAKEFKPIEDAPGQYVLIR